MKKVSILSLVTILMIVISSCGSSNNVVSNSGITKRKYNKGFFFQRNSNLRTADSKVKEDRATEDKALAKQEKVTVKREKKEAETVKMERTNNAIAVTESTNYLSQPAQEEPTTNSRSTEKSSDGLNGSGTESNSTVNRETIEQMPISNKNESSKKQSKRAGGGGSDVNIIILVILAIIIPPLAVFLFEGATSRFWIDLVLALLGYGVGFGIIGGLGGLLALIAVIYALLIVLGAI